MSQNNAQDADRLSATTASSSSYSRHAVWATAAAWFLFVSAAAGARTVNVTTYHNDTLRTGWNSGETSLTPGVVGGFTFGLLHQVALDDQVDAQPLLVAGLTINGAKHDVVYVATEGNTVYAIDAASGVILLQTNLGTPVSISQLPGGCNNNGNNVGIDSTPVIDLSSQTLYVVAYVYASPGGQTFMVHALSLTTLADQVTPVAVAAAHTLSDGKTGYSFTASVNRQRPALLEMEGAIYAGFGSFCDINANQSRGWILGWNAATLAPVQQSQLNNQLLPVNSPDDFFLTSIWMSGYGLASAGGSSLFFVTGNSDYSGTTYANKGAVNLSESVVKWSTAQGRVVSYFSPTDSGADVATLDQVDADFGSGGVMLLPKQPGAYPSLAAAAGKEGILYLMNRANLGGENSGNVLGEYSVGGCWCGPAYFKGSDGVGRLVSSGGNTIHVWKVQTSPSTALVLDSSFTPPSIETGQDGGFFTSVSSNGTKAGTAIIWAVSRPFDATHDVSLYAFDAGTGSPLYSGVAGTWPNTGGNANIVPTVANGKVYVATYGMLSIFGVEGTGQALIAKPQLARPAAVSESSLPAHRVSGVVRASADTRVVIEARDGLRVTVDLSDANKRHTAIHAVIGEPVVARGDYDSAGVLRAESFLHAKPQPLQWPPDR